MRLWSFDPKYLDSIGLVALWRESLLAKKVLQGKTKGYVNHPQLKRFKDSNNAIQGINFYLFQVLNEAIERGYRFDKKKIDFKKVEKYEKDIKVSNGQLKYEFNYFLKKMIKRDYKRYLLFKNEEKIEINKTFKKVRGKIADWEKTK
jgi:hypothetical protein